MPHLFTLIIVSQFVAGLFLSAASTRPWTVLWVFLAHVGSRIGAFLAFALTVVTTFLTSLRPFWLAVPKALENRLVRNLTILAVMAVLCGATPFGGWVLLFLAAKRPRSGIRQKPHPAETQPAPSFDEAAFEVLLGTLSDTEIRQKAAQFTDQLREPTLTACQRQDIRRHRSLCYEALDARRRQRRAQHAMRPQTNTP